jgi:SAM-dependent methyltransferase
MQSNLLKRLMTFLRPEPDLAEPVNGGSYAVRLEKLFSSSSSTLPHELFKNADDGFWLWLNTEGCRTNSRLRDMLPGLPPEYFQLAVASLTGDETLRNAFSIYRLFRTLIEKHHKPVADCSAILDFGCGWGRISRFFLKDVNGAKLWGVDQWKELVEFACQLTRSRHFLHVNQDPPTEFPAEKFDVIFSYSVFSHIDEDAHRRWLTEFKRILKPGGLVIATTWGREHIPFLETIRTQGASSWEDHYNKAIAERFPGTENALAVYDSGGFFHIDLGYPTYPGYGETCIPKQYVYTKWTDCLTVLDYIDDRSVCEQDVIIAAK